MLIKYIHMFRIVDCNVLYKMNIFPLNRFAFIKFKFFPENFILFVYRVEGGYKKGLLVQNNHHPRPKSFPKIYHFRITLYFSLFFMNYAFVS